MVHAYEDRVIIVLEEEIEYPIRYLEQEALKGAEPLLLTGLK